VIVLFTKEIGGQDACAGDEKQHRDAEEGSLGSSFRTHTP
jgi:hypothetical protein